MKYQALERMIEDSYLPVALFLTEDETVGFLTLEIRYHDFSFHKDNVQYNENYTRDEAMNEIAQKAFDSILVLCLKNIQ